MKSVKTLIILAIVAVCGACRGSVKTGLDNVGSHKQLFADKRIGIITNHTAYNSDGRYIVDVFQDIPGDSSKVTALYSPEHGLFGTEQAGKKIDPNVYPGAKSARDLPVYSLYGKTRKPTREMLEDVDILVFDIQDIGARFYTYIYTMSLAMEAAAEFDKDFVVLDRPNPINGVTVEGNILEPRFATFVGLYPIAVRHGMTVGELARMFNGQGWLAKGVKADLTVIPMKGWSRRNWFDQTGLRFIKPSPNMTNLETAAVYPGLCLLEGTNISEGRGTDKPFRQFGAPWIDSKNLAARLNELNLPGMRFVPAVFTPTSSKYKGKQCHGVRIIVTQRDLLEPYWAGIRIVNEIYRMYPDEFEWKTSHFDRLCGTSAVRSTITQGKSLEALKKSWQVRLKSFLQIRAKYLMYRN